MEVYKSVDLNDPFGRFVRRKRYNKEETIYKFDGGEKDGQCEGENDAPKLPILWYTMISLREIIGMFGGGRRA